MWNRRAGKSKTAFNKQLIKAIQKKGIYYYFLPTYKQAKTVIWESIVNEHIPAEVIKNKNHSELTIELVNGSILHYAGCEDIDRHRGINPIDVVFDEYSEMKKEIWTAIIQPILRENRGTATFVFTPKGKNHSYNLYVEAKDPKTDDWFCSLKNVYETKSFLPEEIEKAKLETPQALFQQEYECLFLDDATSVFRNIDQRSRSIDLYPEPGKRYQLGVDLAKYNDYTVISVTDLHNLQSKIVQRFNKVDWDLQLSKIEAEARRWNNADVWVDCTGVGDPIYEMLKNRGLTVKEFKFTERSREQLLSNLAILLEQGRLTIDNDDVLKTELKDFRYALHGTKVKAEVPEGHHDDCVMALALSVWGVDRPLPQPTAYEDNTVTLQIQHFT